MIIYILLYFLFVFIYHSFPNIVIIKTMFEWQCKIESNYFTIERFQITII